MPINLEIVGRKIKLYREQLQIPLQALSVQTGIDLARLEEIERGRLEPSGDEILIFADVFKCDYRFFISNEKLAPFEQTEELYRRFGSEFSKDDRASVQEFLFLCETEVFLERELNRRAVKSFAFIKEGRIYKRHGEEAAAQLRGALGYSSKEVPMDIYSDIRAIGVRVFRRKLGNSNISGLYIRHPQAGKCVLVNYSEDVYRQRFTAAHELGHTILDDDNDVVVSFQRWTKDDLIEIRANTFASRFLMPPVFLKAIPPPWTRDSCALWASKLRVSVSALIYALLDSKLIDDQLASELKHARVSSNAKIDPELPAVLTDRQRAQKKLLLELGLSDYYVDLCFEAYHAGFVSRGRLAECLLLHESDLPEISELYGRALRHAD